MVFLFRDGEATAVKSVDDVSRCGGAHLKTAPRGAVSDVEAPPLPPPQTCKYSSSKGAQCLCLYFIPYNFNINIIIHNFLRYFSVET